MATPDALSGFSVIAPSNPAAQTNRRSVAGNLLHQHESSIPERLTGIDQRHIGDLHRQVIGQAHFAESFEAEVIGAFDVHFEVVRNPMLTQRSPKRTAGTVTFRCRCPPRAALATSRALHSG